MDGIQNTKGAMLSPLIKVAYRAYARVSVFYTHFLYQYMYLSDLALFQPSKAVGLRNRQEKNGVDLRNKMPQSSWDFNPGPSDKQPDTLTAELLAAGGS